MPGPGLIKDGHTAAVFERDADLSRKRGYDLHMNGARETPAMLREVMLRAIEGWHPALRRPREHERAAGQHIAAGSGRAGLRG